MPDPITPAAKGFVAANIGWLAVAVLMFAFGFCAGAWLF